MSAPPSFAPLAHALRDEVIEHYERKAEPLATPAGLRTLDTNSTLAADRARTLLRLLAEAGAGPVAGRRVLDLGAGFGTLGLYFAHLGAEVVAVDPNQERMQVALTVARAHGLALTTIAAAAEALPLPSGHFDFAIANNSLCYIVDRAARREALSEIRRVLAPGGWLAIRNPNRLHHRDQFTGIPLLPLLPPALARRAVRAAGRHRSEVRMSSPLGATLELRSAGFTAVRWTPGEVGRAKALLSGYHHTLARAPVASG